MNPAKKNGDKKGAIRFIVDVPEAWFIHRPTTKTGTEKVSASGKAGGLIL